MWIEITQANVQLIKAKTSYAGLRKAKRELKLKLGSKLYRELITDIKVTVLEEKEVHQ